MWYNGYIGVYREDREKKSIRKGVDPSPAPRIPISELAITVTLSFGK